MRIVLVASSRSYSNSLLDELQKQYNIRDTYLELFSHKTFTRERRVEQFNSNDSAITKLVPGCFNTPGDYTTLYDVHTKNLLDNADKIFYCYRRDTEQQIYSLAVALKTSEWGPRRTKTVRFNLLSDSDSKELLDAEERVIKNYRRMIELFDSYPGEIICSEDYLENKPYANRRKSPYKYNGPNIENLFKELQWKPS